MRRLILLAVAATLLLGSKSGRDSYIIALGQHLRTVCNVSVEDLVSLREHMPERYIWVRRDGRPYLIVDETLLRQFAALFEPQRALAPEQEKVSREESKLDREIDALEDRDDDGGRRTPAEEKRLEELRARMRVVAQRERELDRKEAELERAAERAFWPLVDDAIRSGLANPYSR